MARLLAFAAAAMVALSIVAVSARAEAPKIGDIIGDFTLVDVHESQAVSLTDYEDTTALVLIFVATQCPVSNDYNERMAALLEAYEEQPIQFIGINSNKQEPFHEVLEHAQQNGLAFPILKDVDNKIADRFDARVTPEVYVLSVDGDGETPKLVLRYHGAIDNNQNEEKVKRKYLEEALNALLADEDVPKAKTKAFGCAIKRVSRDAYPGSAP